MRNGSAPFEELAGPRCGGSRQATHGVWEAFQALGRSRAMSTTERLDSTLSSRVPRRQGPDAWG